MDASQQEADAYTGTGRQTGYRAALPSANAATSALSSPKRPVVRDGFAQSGLAGARDLERSVSAPVAGGMLNRKGLLGWWLNLTSPAWPVSLPPIAERERLRKAELTSLSILAVALLLATLLSANITRPATAISALLAGAGLVLAAALNRSGWTRTAAYLVPSVLMLAVIGAIVWADGGLRLATVPAYDLFVLPIFLTSLIGDRRAPWVFATLAIAFILCDVILHPHALITAGGVTGFDDMQYALNVEGWWGLVDGPLALSLFAALFGWLGALSVESAITRADRAEEIAALEHQAAVQKRQLEVGVRQILATHVRVANGDFSARAPLGQDNVLWQIGSSLNNLVARMQRMAQSDQALRRTEAELRRIAASLDEVEAGSRPTWPSPSGTAADLVLVRIAHSHSQGSAPSPQTLTLSLASDSIGSLPGIPAVPWRAASLIDPDVLAFGQTAVLPETHLARQSLIAPATDAATASVDSESRPLPPRLEDTLPRVGHPLAVSQPANPDSWPAWLADSGARRLAGAPELAEAAAPLAQAEPSVPSVPITSNPSPLPPVPSAAPSEPALRSALSPSAADAQSEQITTEPPSNTLADAWSNVPWRSETRRRRAQFLGPAPNPPWMDPNEQ